MNIVKAEIKEEGEEMVAEAKTEERIEVNQRILLNAMLTKINFTNITLIDKTNTLRLKNKIETNLVVLSRLESFFENMI